LAVSKGWTSAENMGLTCKKTNEKVSSVKVPERLTRSYDAYHGSRLTFIKSSATPPRSGASRALF
jgi:hypothetical protein